MKEEKLAQSKLRLELWAQSTYVESAKTHARASENKCRKKILARKVISDCELFDNILTLLFLILLLLLMVMGVGDGDDDDGDDAGGGYYYDEGLL